MPAAEGLFREFLPDSGVHLVIRLSPSGGRMALLGPATEKASFELVPGATYLGVRFRTAQAPRLADLPAAELTDGHAEVLRIGRRPADAVMDELQSLPDLAARQRLLEPLLRWPAPPLVTNARCRNAARAVEARGGQLRVHDLAREAGLHVRSLERLLRAELGISPKRLIRLVRLRQVLGALHHGGYGTLADLAHACGYADQPHMVKDFRHLTGFAPSQERARRGAPLVAALTRIVHRHRT